MFNADGCEAEMCGNGIRCVAKYVYDHGLARKPRLKIETGRGVLTLDLEVKGDRKVRARAASTWASRSWRRRTFPPWSPGVAAHPEGRPPAVCGRGGGVRAVRPLLPAAGIEARSRASRWATRTRSSMPADVRAVPLEHDRADFGNARRCSRSGSTSTSSRSTRRAK